MKTTEIKQKIQQLISQTVADNERQKQRLHYLFRRLEEIKELETMDRLRQFPNSQPFLKAYLLYKSITRANYQPELLAQIDFGEGEAGLEKFLMAMEADIDNSFKEEPPTNEPLTNQQLLLRLSDRLARGEIRVDSQNLVIADQEGQEISRLDLAANQFTPDPAEEFLAKYGLNAKK